LSDWTHILTLFIPISFSWAIYSFSILFGVDSSEISIFLENPYLFSNVSIIFFICIVVSVEGVPHQKYTDCNHSDTRKGEEVISSHKEWTYWAILSDWTSQTDANRQYLHLLSQNGMWI